MLRTELASDLNLMRNACIHELELGSIFRMIWEGASGISKAQVNQLEI